MNNDFEMKGEWFVPSDKRNRVFGTLFFNSEGASKLELLGNFNNESIFPEFREDNIILGITNNSSLVTLYKCYTSNIDGPKLVKGQESGLPKIIYTVNYILIGVHIENEKDLKFDKISCEIFNFDEWVGISGFEYNPMNQKKHEITISYKLPDPIEFPIDNKCKGRIKFVSNSPRWSRYQKTIDITQRVELQIYSYDEEKSLSEMLEYYFKFQNFLILALYQNTFPISIYLTSSKYTEHFSNVKPVKTKIQLYISTSNINRYTKPKFDLDMLFSYQTIKEEFPSLIKSWYKKYNILAPAFNLLFEQFYKANQFNINTFLNLAQAAETFHARLNNSKKMPKEDYKKMKEEILAVTPSVYHEWLHEQFNFGNNLKLHDRLMDLLNKYSNKIIDKIIGDKEKFIKEIKHSRNYYTHYSQDLKKKAIKGKDLFYLTEKLKALLVCAFLMEIGFTKIKLEELLDNVKWRFFNHLVDWKNENN
ncbi:MAG: HEPN domain-containing protein [bacterium]